MHARKERDSSSRSPASPLRQSRLHHYWWNGRHCSFSRTVPLKCSAHHPRASARAGMAVLQPGRPLVRPCGRQPLPQIRAQRAQRGNLMAARQELKAAAQELVSADSRCCGVAGAGAVAAGRCRQRPQAFALLMLVCAAHLHTHPLHPTMRFTPALGPLLPSALQEVAEASSSSSSSGPPRPGSTAPADGGMQSGSQYRCSQSDAQSGSHTGGGSNNSSGSSSSSSDKHMLDSSQDQPVAGLAQGSSCSSQQPRLLQQEQQQQQQSTTAAAAVPPGPAAAAAPAATAAATEAGVLFPPSERTQVRNSWDSLMRWSRYFRCADAIRQPACNADC